MCEGFCVGPLFCRVALGGLSISPTILLTERERAGCFNCMAVSPSSRYRGLVCGLSAHNHIAFSHDATRISYGLQLIVPCTIRSMYTLIKHNTLL